MPRPFVILMTGRTGSSYLVSALQSHPRAMVVGERLVGLSEASEQLAWIERFYRRWRFRIKSVGFKTKLKDVVDRDALAEVLLRHEARVIMVLRRDALRQAISVIRARELKAAHGVWNQTVNTPDLEPSLVDLADLDAVLADVSDRNLELDHFASTLDLPRHVVHYEKLLADPTGTLGAVQDFLGLRRRALTASTRKNTADELEITIRNYDEMRKHLVGTEYERFLA